MNTNKIINYVPKYSIIEKENTEKAILDDLIYGNKFTEISFSYKTETLIQFVYYCLTYFFKNKTYGESFHNMELTENNCNGTSYLYKLKILLPNLLKLILKYLSINNSLFNFIFHGSDLIDLIICIESGNNKCNGYDSALNYLLNLKYRLINNKIDGKITYSNWSIILIDKITDIISEIISYNSSFFKSAKDKLFNIFGFNINQQLYYCQICKQFPTNSISFKCGHFYCYYCFYYYSQLFFPEKDLANICFICNNN